MGAVVSCITGLFRAIGDCIMTVVNGVATIVMTIVNGIVHILSVIVRFLTCGYIGGGRGGTRGHGHSTRSRV